MQNQNDIQTMSKNAAAAVAPEIKDIKKNVDSLKTNVVGLAHTLKDVGAEKASAAAEYVRDQVDTLKTSGAETLEKAEARIKKQPAQSVAIAFAAGIIASYILGRRS